MRRLLLTVEERFFASNRGLLLIKPWLIDLAATGMRATSRSQRCSIYTSASATLSHAQLVGL